MTKQELLEVFQINNAEPIRKAVQAFIQDKNNSFEDRLEVWQATPTVYSTHDPYILHLPAFEKKWGEISWYDNFYVERYVRCDLRDCEETGYFENEVGELNEEKLRDFQEACMAAGIHSFTFDW